MGNISAVTDAEFEAQVLKSDKPVLVDFWAEWCGPCRQVAPILDEIATAHGDKVTFFKMNVDENPVTPSSYRVTGIPTINVYQGGEVVKTHRRRPPEGEAAQRARRVHLSPPSALVREARRRLRRRASRRFRARIAPTSRSNATSTSSFQLSAVRSSIRIRGVRRVRTVRLEADAAEELHRQHGTGRRGPTGRRTPRSPGSRRARSGRAPSPAPASGPARPRGTPARRAPSSAAPRPEDDRGGREACRPGHERLRRVDAYPTGASSTRTTRPHEPHSRRTSETQASFSAQASAARSRRTGSSSQKQARAARRGELLEMIKGQPDDLA